MPARIPSYRPPGAPTPRQTRADYDRSAKRQEANAFYWSAAWRHLRAWFLRENPLCVMCRAKGRPELAVIVDHVIDRLERPDLALDPSNLQSLCRYHHGVKTAKGRP